MLAEKQGTTVPLMIGHRITGVTLVSTGDFVESRAHLDRAFSLYDLTEHRVLATRFGQDPGVTILSFRSWALWFLGYPEAALTDAEQALQDAREIGQAATSMFALGVTPWTYVWCGNYAVASSLADELVLLAGKKVSRGGRQSGHCCRLNFLCPPATLR